MAQKRCGQCGRAMPTWANGICYSRHCNKKKEKSTPYAYVIDELDELISKGGGSRARSMRKTALSIIETMEEMQDNGIRVPTEAQERALKNISKAARKRSKEVKKNSTRKNKITGVEQLYVSCRCGKTTCHTLRIKDGGVFYEFRSERYLISIPEGHVKCPKCGRLTEIDDLDLIG